LNRSNRNPMDLVTDGASIWVVNATRTTDKVFRYTVGGTLEGSWQIDAANAKPTGLTIDPHDVNHIWVIDSRTDSVYQYEGAAGRTSGSQAAGATFRLASSNRNPQGIADPQPSGVAGSLGDGWTIRNASSASTDQTLHWENPTNPLDTNDDGSVSPLDGLLILNHLNQPGANDVLSLDVDAPFLDVNADGWVTPIDALAVINFLNRPRAIPVVTLFDKAIEQLTAEDARLDLPDLIDGLGLADENVGRLSDSTGGQRVPAGTRDLNIQEAISDLSGEDEGGDGLI